jgi:2-polyprenyl-6-methoxyphenol hydroxylase-like FAD-dependent oxidoreductase
MELTSPRIVIVGAGPGGLACARILQLHGVAVTVYDADVALLSRVQGGTLDLHADSGQIAIEDAQLTEEFARLARPEGQSKRILDPSGNVLVEHVVDASENAAPEIDRGQLRAMLAESLAPGTIQWGRKLRSVTPDDTGPAALTFADGCTEMADLVVGADGAWSRVRAALTDAVPAYTGVSMIEVRFDDVQRRFPYVAELVGDGHLWANGDGRSMILQRNSGDVVRGYLGMRIDLDWLFRTGLGAPDGRGGVIVDSPGLDASQTQAADTQRVRGALRGYFADFAPQFLRLIDDSDGDLPNRPIFALPVPMTWTHRRAVTLLGDAAHLMAPFGGEGVNLALLDGAELARAIAAAITAGAPIDDAVAGYEKTMTERAAPIAEGANAAIVEHFAAGGPDLDNLPDFDAEAEQWKASAETYRAAQTG